jgi:hypothetical protein
MKFINELIQLLLSKFENDIKIKCKMRHLSVTFFENTNSNINPLSYGMNQFYTQNHNHNHNQNINSCSIHAECDALNKLQFKNERFHKISLLVIRINNRIIIEDDKIKSLNLGNSKPCIKCIQSMYNVQAKGYKIINVYYSDADGNIIKRKFGNLLHDPNYHVSRYYKNVINKNTFLLNLYCHYEEEKIKKIIINNY